MHGNQHLEATGTDAVFSRSQIPMSMHMVFSRTSAPWVYVFLTPMDDHLKVVDFVGT
jgi:hypothetical protein